MGVGAGEGEGGGGSDSAFVLPHRSHALVSATTLAHLSRPPGPPPDSSPLPPKQPSPPSSPALSPLSWFEQVAARGGVQWLEGITGVLAIDSPENIFHSAGKAFQLSHALEEFLKTSEKKSKKNRDTNNYDDDEEAEEDDDEEGDDGDDEDEEDDDGDDENILRRVIPLSCPRHLGRCVPALERATNASGAWLLGLLDILFVPTSTETSTSSSSSSRSTDDNELDNHLKPVDIVTDPHAYAHRDQEGRSGGHERSKRSDSGDRGGNGKEEAHDIEEEEREKNVELMCFHTLLLPGESRALFRGPADARKFRLKARRYLGLSPVALQPPPKVLIVQRPLHKRSVANLDTLLNTTVPQLLHPPPPPPPPPPSSPPPHTKQCLVGIDDNAHEQCDQNDTKDDEDEDDPQHKDHPAAPDWKFGRGSLSSGRGAVEVQVLRPETVPSFAEQVAAFSDAGVVVLVHGAAVANLIFSPVGAAVVELKQYGEFGTQPRDLAAAAQLHHAVVRSARPPPSARVNTQPFHRSGGGVDDVNKGDESAGPNFRSSSSSGSGSGSGWCPMTRPLDCHAGAPMSFCASMSYHPGSHDVHVDPVKFKDALADALAVTGLRPLACEGTAATATKATAATNAMGGGGGSGKCGTTAIGWGGG